MIETSSRDCVEDFLGDFRINQVHDVHGFADAEIDGLQGIGVSRREPFSAWKIDSFLKRDFVASLRSTLSPIAK
jgi:hypothetical protein